MASKPPIRNSHLTIYFSKDEMAALVKAANAEGVGVSVWCLRALLRACGAGEDGHCEHGVKTGDYCPCCGLRKNEGI